MWVVATTRPTVTRPSIFTRPAIPSSKAMTRPKVGDGAMSTRWFSTSPIAPRRRTAQSRATTERAAGSPFRRIAAEIRLHPAAQLDGQRHAAPVYRLADGDADPALADAVFLDRGLLDAVEADAHPPLEERRVVMRAFRIVRQ